MNGWKITCDNTQAYRYFMHLFETEKFVFGKLKKWLNQNMVRERDDDKTT
ncbi:MAG: hypothetical protein AAF471_05895 [Myxococcota bacterium]